MANIRYFADQPDGSVLMFDRVDYRGPKDMRGYDHATARWVPCNRKVEYKSSPSRHECDDRCMNATGRVMKCECKCGGKNHGRGSHA